MLRVHDDGRMPVSAREMDMALRDCRAVFRGVEVPERAVCVRSTTERPVVVDLRRAATAAFVALLFCASWAAVSVVVWLVVRALIGGAP